MASSTISSKQVTLTVPAPDVEGFRIALTREIEADTGMLRDSDPLESGVEILDRGVRLLDQLLAGGDGDVELTAVHDKTSSPLLHALEEFVRVLTERLQAVGQYSPLPMGEVLDITDGLEWAAREAIRMEPDVDHQLTAAERERAAA